MRCIYEADLSTNLKRKIRQLASDYAGTETLLVKFAKKPKGKKALGTYYETFKYQGVLTHFQSHWLKKYKKFIFINVPKHNSEVEIFQTFAHEFKHFLQDISGEEFSEPEAQRFEVEMTNQHCGASLKLEDDEKRSRIVVKNGKKTIYSYRPRYFTITTLKGKYNV